MKRLLLANIVLVTAGLFLSYQAGVQGQSRIAIPQGTAGRPSLYFSFNDRTGFYAKDSATLGFSVDGVEVMTFGRNGVTETGIVQDTPLTIEAPGVHLVNDAQVGAWSLNMNPVDGDIEILGAAGGVNWEWDASTAGDLISKGFGRLVGRSNAVALTFDDGLFNTTIGQTNGLRLTAVGNTTLTLASPSLAPVIGHSLNLEGNVRQMDGSDTSQAFRIHVTNQNHTGTGNRLSGVSVNLAGGPDADATEIGLEVQSTWDYFLSTRTMAANPPAPVSNEVAFYVNETEDWGAGTATADCALVARLQNTTDVVISVLVTDGGCP